MTLFARFDRAALAAFLAERGLYRSSDDEATARARAEAWAAADPERLLRELAHHPHLALMHEGAWPGRYEALRRLGRRLACRLPAAEYVLPEDTLEALLERARATLGRRLHLRGAAGHKGRVGDAVERLLLGQRYAGEGSDHPAAEIKSVPVSGERIVERVKLGVLSARSNPLAKCERVLFVFVEQRGADHFVRAARLHEFAREGWAALWQRGHLIETAAGSPERPARGLYLTPAFFRGAGLWPGRP